MTKIVGHRGARNLWLENSMEGFRKTLELPVDAIEFDVHLTDAGELVVIHDATLDRTAEGTGKVRSLSPDLRQAINLRGSQESIPTLDEVLGLFVSSRPVELHVELKADADGVPYEGLEALAAAALERHGLVVRSLLTSFNLDVLAKCRSVAPEIGRLCSINAKSAERLGVAATVARAAELADLVAVEKTLLAASAAEIEAIISRERLCCWVLNERAELEHWLGQGVGWITSDDPSLALAVRAASRDAAA
ncbi:glycerophosphodiester phosphodiesterase family protein [Rhizobium sp. S96]|uniref:glycerophosphodiester phosphodiesterase family protein n=1 Tax=Rhizobium sp. S96 TaxID=3055140 RepID=UPI0025AAC933|nr:glycerophosphodiester phosphodiesterase family protein [Rhizobium sp. S96]MDM9623991.1 glycerophosphodiester phosphodiesterase family protein [Rhizobium sp. S96]